MRLSCLQSFSVYLFVVGRFHQGADIQYQADLAVTEDGAAGDAGDVADEVGQTLYNRLLLAEDLVDEQAETVFLILQHDQNAICQLPGIGVFVEDVVQPYDRQEVFPETGQFLSVRGDGDMLHFRAVGFQNRQSRDNAGGRADADDHAVDDCQGQRNPQVDFGSLTFDTADVDFALDLFQIFLDYVHPHASTGDVGDFCGRRKPRSENQVVDLFVAQVTAVPFNNPFADRLFQNLCLVQTAAVIFDGDPDLSLLVPGGQPNGSLLLFAGSGPFFGGFQAVVERIAQQVDQRVGDGFNNRFVDFSLFANQFQINFFAGLDRDVVDQS